MTLTLDRVCSFASRTLSANGGGLYQALTGSGTGSIDTGVYKDSATPQSFKIVSTGSNYLYLNFTEVNSYGVIVGRVSVYFAGALPISNDSMFISCPSVSDATFAVIGFDASNSKLFAFQYGGTKVYSANTITYNTWYDIDFRFTWNSTTHTIDWAINQVAQTQYSLGGQSNTTFTALRIGATAGVYWAATTHFWCLAFGHTSADFPISTKATMIRCLYPGADSTIDNATNCIEDDDGNDINGSTYPGYTMVRSVQPGAPSATEYLRVGTASAGKYASMTLTDLGATDTPLAVMAYLAYTAASTTADNAACCVLDGATEREIWGITGTYRDYSDGSTSSLYFKAAMIAVGTLNKTNVDALKIKWISGDDATPDPYLIDVWVEVLVEVSIDQTISCTAAALASAGRAVTMVPGAKSIAVTVPILASAGRTVTVKPITTLPITARVLASAGRTAAVLPGAKSIAITAAVLAGAGRMVTIFSPSAQSIPCVAAILASAGRTVTILPGAKAIATTITILSSAGRTATVVPGGKAIQITAAVLASAGRTVIVAVGASTISTQLASLISAGRNATILPGAKSIPCVAAILANAGRTVTILPGAKSIATTITILSSAGRHATILPGAKSIPITAAILASAGRHIAILTGGMIGCSPAQLSTAGRNAIVVPGAVTVPAQAAELAAQGQAATVIPGGISVTVLAALLAVAGHSVVVSGMADFYRGLFKGFYKYIEKGVGRQ